jgi:hypothetical protein
MPDCWWFEGYPMWAEISNNRTTPMICCAWEYPKSEKHLAIRFGPRPTHTIKTISVWA